MNFGSFKWITLAAVLIASVACGPEGSSSAASAAPTAGLSTATPGGSVSVWLLTTTPTLEGQPHLATTPLGPVATATAEAQLADALTATAAAPTVTPALLGAPEQCPPLSAATLPLDRPPFLRYADVIGKFLSAGGAPAILEAGLRTWGAINLKGGLVRADRDMTGDGAPEVLVIALDPAVSNRTPQPGDLLIYGCQNQTFRLLHQAGYESDGGAPALNGLDDLNGDGASDLIYITQPCVAAGCASEVHLVGWSDALNRLGDLSGGPIGAYQPSVIVSPTAGPAQEVSITSAPNPDAAAGPPRASTTILRWDGSLFVVAQVLKSPPQYRIQAIADGDDALAAGDGAGAAELYQRAADAADLLEWGIPNEGALLTIFARYRLILAYTLANRLDMAQTTHDQLLALFAPPPTVEGLPTPFPISAPPVGIEYVNMADLFWQNFAINRDLGRACAGVIEYARVTPAAVAPLNSFGYANPQYTPEKMCPLRR